MSQVKPTYEEWKEFNTIAKKIIENQDEIFPAVDVEELLKKIKAVLVTNKDRKDGSDYFKLHTVKMPMRLFSDVSYVFELWQSDIDNMEKTTKEWLILTMLRRIPVDSDDEGKTLPYDLKDDHLVCSSAGVDWQLRDDLPSLTDPKQTISWGSYYAKEEITATSASVIANKTEVNTNND